ncbi:MAG TPA: amidohydrolase family protein [Gemmatimonadaceae bacterium]|nr:amidohydrolase family protein [Gemmatimonadaceae bacterium]
MARGILLAIPAALGVAASGALAQVNPGAPPAAISADYALTNVRIVTAPGRVIERGTIVIRNGRIAAVGAQVTVPAGVVQMDLNGHSVFPGLIDAATSVGLPSTARPPATTPAGGAPQGRGGGGRGGNNPGLVPTVNQPPAPAPEPTLPELDASAEAADMFSPTADQLKNLRAGGVTTVGLVFDGGIFPGRVGAALTGGPNEDRLSLRTAAGQNVSFGTRRGGYPSTLIGALAFVRQALLDAQYEARLDKAFKAGVPGARPTNEPFTRALVPAATNEMPAWFVASTERQINRVADITKELGLKGPVVVGAQEGWRVAPTLKAMGATAVVSLNWPNPLGVTGASFAGGTPDQNAVTAEIRRNAAALARAGVPVALASYGGESGSSFRDRIRSTIEAGMSPDDALRAATVTPAALLGVTAAVGTIEVGKLANLVVVTGNDLFASGTPIRHVFVEGRLY